MFECPFICVLRQGTRDVVIGEVKTQSAVDTAIDSAYIRRLKPRNNRYLAQVRTRGQSDEGNSVEPFIMTARGSLNVLPHTSTLFIAEFHNSRQFLSQLRRRQVGSSINRCGVRPFVFRTMFPSVFLKTQTFGRRLKKK